MMRKIPHLIYWIFGAVVLFLLGWLLFGTHSHGIAEQRPSPSATLSASTISNPSSTPSRMIVGEPLQTRLSSQNNAATEWRKAFALMVKLTEREKEFLKIKPPTDSAPTEAEIAALLEKIDPIITLLRAGAAKPGCDWGLPEILTFSTNLPHLPQAALLGRIARWDSIQRVETEPQEAVQNMIALANLGNSLQSGTASSSTNTNIHGWIFDFLGTHPDSFSGSDRERMQTIIDGPGFAQATQASLNTELDMIKSTIRAFETGQNAGGIPLTEKEKQKFKMFLGSAASEIELLGQLQEFEEVRQQSLYWRDDQFQNWLVEYRRRTSNPALLEVAEDSIGMRDRYRKVLTNQQMVNAGWAVMKEGPNAVARSRDPLTGKPFGYREMDQHGSFELQSEVLDKGKPLTMTFQRTGG